MRQISLALVLVTAASAAAASFVGGPTETSPLRAPVFVTAGIGGADRLATHPLAQIRIAQSAAPAAPDGYWALERTEFFTTAGKLKWTGQNGIAIEVIEHDTAQFTIREVEPQARYSQTYTIAWHVPDKLMPGEVAPFALEETCKQSNHVPNWPVPVIMALANLVANFKTGEYLQVANAECVPGRTVRASPLQWKIPAGKAGDTTLVRAATNPTAWSPVEQRFHYKWVSGPPPGPSTSGPSGGAGGRWTLERTEFWTRTGELEWSGQAGVRIKVLQHDGTHFTISETEPQGRYSQTYVIAWRVPEKLAPGDVAPFALEETCTRSEHIPNWPVPVKMPVANLIANFNTDSFLQVADVTCVPGQTTRAPALQWKIPPGKPGDTTLIRVATVPTFWAPIEQRFYYKWESEADPG